MITNISPREGPYYTRTGRKKSRDLGKAVVAIAQKFGWNPQDDGFSPSECTPDTPRFFDVWDAAEKYLDDEARDADHYWGTDERGNYGYFRVSTPVRTCAYSQGTYPRSSCPPPSFPLPMGISIEDEDDEDEDEVEGLYELGEPVTYASLINIYGGPIARIAFQVLDNEGYVTRSKNKEPYIDFVEPYIDFATGIRGESQALIQAADHLAEYMTDWDTVDAFELQDLIHKAYELCDAVNSDFSGLVNFRKFPLPPKTPTSAAGSLYG